MLRLFLVLITLCSIRFVLLYPIEIPMTKSKRNTYYMKVCFGTPTQCFDLTMAPDETSIILYEDCPFTSDFSMTYSVVSRDSNLIDCEDKITLMPNTVINNIRFIRLMNIKPHRIGSFGIGLTHNTADPTNILNQLFKNAPKRLIYFDAIRDVFGYGNFPKEYYSLSNSLLRKKCKLVLDHSIQEKGYYCVLNSIYFTSKGNTEFNPINKDVEISFSMNGIQVPYEFFQLIKEKYLYEALKSSACRENENNDEFQYIICNSLFNENSLDNITAIIGNWSFRLTPQDLFFQYKHDKIFLIMHRVNRPKWIFGYPFFKNYVTIIDLELMEMMFMKPLTPKH